MELNEQKPYNVYLIKLLVSLYQTEIDYFFEISSTIIEKMCYVLESPKWEENNYSFYKVKLHFPYCVTTKEFMKTDFSKRIIEKLNSLNEINEYFNTACLTNWKTAFQDFRDVYELYGSVSNPKISPLKVKHILTEIEDGEDLSHFSYYDTIKSKNNRDNLGCKEALYMKHSFITENMREIGLKIEDDSDIENEDKYLKFLYPILLSINFKTTKTKNKFEADDDFDLDIKVNEENPTDFDICYSMMSLLKKERFKFEYFIYDLGKAIYNSLKNNKNYDHEFGFKFWRNSVLKSTLEWKDLLTDKTYDLFEDSNITFKTICYYAKEDSPKKFKKWHDNWIQNKVSAAVDSQNDRDLSLCFYRKYFMMFMYGGDVNKNYWYRFENNLMVIVDKHYIFSRLMKDFKDVFYKYEIKMETKKLQIMQEGDAGHKEKVKAIKDKIETIQKIQEKVLGNSTTIKKLLECSETWFYIESLNDKWDKNPNILGCKNCVIELTSTKAHVRDGKPEDFLQKKLGVKYEFNYCKNSKNVKDLLKYLEQVFPVPEVRHYMIKDLSSILYGKNSEKQMRIWIGETNGSKSILAKIIQEVFGSYYCDFPGEYLSAKQKNGGPSPELAQIKNTRIAIIQEPDKHASFQGARIKKLTGGDSMFARALHDNGGSIKTTCKFLVVCNCVPEIEGLDEATKNRVVQVPFEGRWIKKGAKKNEEHFVVPKTHNEQVKAKLYDMDLNFENKVVDLAKAMLWFLIDNYNLYCKEGLIPPTYLKDWMDEYWKKFDPNVCFLSENIERMYTPCECETDDCTKCYGTKQIKDKAYSITSNQFYNHYKNWFRSEFSHKTLSLKANVIEMFETRDKLGKLSKDKKWYGIKLVDNKNSDSLGLF